jgi:hypothetical protein
MNGPTLTFEEMPERGDQLFNLLDRAGHVTYGLWILVRQQMRKGEVDALLLYTACSAATLTLDLKTIQEQP